MKVTDVMTRDVEMVRGDATIDAAAQVMAELGIGCVPVGERDKLEGILTDRDVIIRVVAVGGDPKAVRVAEVMSSNVFTCREDDSVQRVAELMGEHQIRRMPVLSDKGALVGLVSLSDLATEAASRPARAAPAEAPEEVSEPDDFRAAAGNKPAKGNESVGG